MFYEWFNPLLSCGQNNSTHIDNFVNSGIDNIVSIGFWCSLCSKVVGAAGGKSWAPLLGISLVVLVFLFK